MEHHGYNLKIWIDDDARKREQIATVLSVSRQSISLMYGKEKFTSTDIEALNKAGLKIPGVTAPGVLDFSIKFDRHHLRKEVLTEQELAILEKTECGNNDVYRAFMFCALATGLRMGDVAKLTWYDLRGWNINIQQGKTGRNVRLPINKMGQRFAGIPGKPNSLVFPKLDCSANNVNKVLKFWVNKAGLQKHVTFHSARHTFCTLLMKRKVDYKTIISAMGWDEKSGMEHILRYAHLVDENVKDAVSQLDSIAL